ncbi:uracil-DNA glycosylase [Sporolactobacillus spathodeae]|uniref:Uracil-DNA glycosylase n=1 Tax=Sporolactobacillus spathodeae TaxID=1465502 RepID=A0ABS2Q9S3_9BACL|nr:uracil-DNA glycosylase [Sporolactobacillus spathodeae]MBM7658536.1 uracil-DNA glycosylase [Sporolactobacillus spathodeae]
MKHILTNDWESLLEPEFQKDYYQKLRSFLKEEYSNQTIYPDMYDLFNALNYTPYHQVKVVILGQDPYHEPGQAHGLSFSVRPGVRQPPSLQNIFKELNDDLGCPIPRHGCLIEWARQGVLMLNTVLSVRRGAANSHKGMGWEQFTDTVIRDLNAREQPIVFILWGRHAQAKEELITNAHHFIIKSSHPSPFSARYGFFGSHPFSRANHFLKSAGEEPINWAISLEEPSVSI